MMDMGSWNTRGLTSLCVFSTFLVMTVSGLVLYIGPEGRVAYWVNWSLIGLTKTDWGAIHTLSSLAFAVAGFFHIVFNFRTLLHYLWNRLAAGLRLKKEIAVVVLATVVICLSAVMHWPPLSYLIDLSSAIKESWVVSRDYEPPFGHAELVSLSSFCRKTGIPLDSALVALDAGGIHDARPERRMADIAASHRMTPLELYRIIKHLEPADTILAVFTPQSVEERFADSGIGGRTMKELAREAGADPALLEMRLRAQGLEVGPDETLKPAAARLGVMPLELLKTALVEDYVPARD